MNPEPLLNTEEVATWLKCSDRTVRTLKRKGLLPATCFILKGPRWSVEDVQAYIDRS